MTSSPDEMLQAALFHEEQRFSRVWSIVPASIAVITLLAFGPWAFDIRSALALAVGVAGPAFLAWWIGRAVMVTEVTRDIVRVNFPWPWTSRTIPIADVRTHATGHRPFREQGTQSFDRESMFSVSGRNGVSLDLADGRKVFIGSQRPDELDAAIKVALGE